jgi:hypothetical protein
LAGVGRHRRGPAGPHPDRSPGQRLPARTGGAGRCTARVSFLDGALMACPDGRVVLLAPSLAPYSERRSSDLPVTTSPVTAPAPM